jgi:hypothetical protein
VLRQRKYHSTLPKPERKQKILNTFKALDDTHFEPFVVESGEELGVRSQAIFKKICNLITQLTGQSRSSIAYFWKSRLLVTLAKITHSNETRWAMAHNSSNDDSNFNLYRALIKSRRSDDKFLLEQLRGDAYLYYDIRERSITQTPHENCDKCLLRLYSRSITY